MKRYLSLLVVPDEETAEKWFRQIGDENIDFADAIRPADSPEGGENLKQRARKLRMESQVSDKQSLHVFIAGRELACELMASQLPRLDLERGLRSHRLLDEYDRVAVGESVLFRVLKDRGVIPTDVNSWSAMHNVVTPDKERREPQVAPPGLTPELLIKTIEDYVAEVPGRKMQDVLDDVSVEDGEGNDVIVKMTTRSEELSKRLRAIGIELTGVN